MSVWQITGAVGFLMWFAAFIGGLILVAAAACNKIAYWVEARYTEPPENPVVQRCEVYTLRPRQSLDALETARPRRGDAA